MPGLSDSQSGAFKNEFRQFYTSFLFPSTNFKYCPSDGPRLTIFGADYFFFLLWRGLNKNYLRRNNNNNKSRPWDKRWRQTHLGSCWFFYITHFTWVSNRFFRALKNMETKSLHQNRSRGGKKIFEIYNEMQINLSDHRFQCSTLIQCEERKKDKQKKLRRV